jgi:hypothetical protein
MLQLMNISAFNLLSLSLIVATEIITPSESTLDDSSQAPCVFPCVHTSLATLAAAEWLAYERNFNFSLSELLGDRKRRFQGEDSRNINHALAPRMRERNQGLHVDRLKFAKLLFLGIPMKDGSIFPGPL